MSNAAHKSNLEEAVEYGVEDIHALQDEAYSHGPVSNERARPIPRISIQAFCENVETASMMELVGEDRRLAKVHLSVHMGGLQAALAHYQEQPSPNLIVLEINAEPAGLARKP